MSGLRSLLRLAVVPPQIGLVCRQRMCWMWCCPTCGSMSSARRTWWWSTSGCTTTSCPPTGAPAAAAALARSSRALQEMSRQVRQLCVLPPLPRCCSKCLATGQLTPACTGRRADLDRLGRLYAAQRGRFPHLLWRETTPQHFMTPDGLYSHRLGPPPFTCKPLTGVTLHKDHTLTADWEEQARLRCWSGRNVPPCSPRCMRSRRMRG